MVHEDWIPYRVALLGNYGVDLALKREINRFLLAEDPYGSAAFVRLGIARGEVRSDVDPPLIASILEWTMERFQDALLTEELDPGLFPHPADPEKNQIRIQQFLLVLRGAIGALNAAARTSRASCTISQERSCMEQTVQEILASYNARLPLAEAYTIPAPWYTDPRIARARAAKCVFAHVAGRSGASSKSKSRANTSLRPSPESRSSSFAAATTNSARSSTSAATTPWP